MQVYKGVQPETVGLAARSPKLTLGLMAHLIICLRPRNERAELKRAANVRAVYWLALRFVAWPRRDVCANEWIKVAVSAGWARSEISYPGRSEKEVKLPLCDDELIWYLCVCCTMHKLTFGACVNRPSHCVTYLTKSYGLFSHRQICRATRDWDHSMTVENEAEPNELCCVQLKNWTHILDWWKA